MSDMPPPHATDEVRARLHRTSLEPSLGDLAYLERQSLAVTLRALARHMRHGAILDLGCGIKPYQVLLAQPDDRWVGVDHPASMAGSYAGLTAADVLADGHALPFRDGEFDTVLCTQVLEHVANPAQVLTEAARVLKPGGTLILTAPMVWPLHEEPFDFFRYTQYGLRQLLTGAGLEVVEELQRGRGASALGQAFLDLHLGHRKPTFLNRAYKQCLCRMVNGVCSWLDRRAPARRLALGWAIAARKRAGEGTDGGGNREGEQRKPAHPATREQP